MPGRRPLTMKLAQFIQAGKEQLLEDWEEAALEIAPQLTGADGLALRDNAHEILEFIVQDLATPQTREESACKALGKGKGTASDIGGEHGRNCFSRGLSVLQMVQELGALRARVTRAWSDEQHHLMVKETNELVRFNEAIDQLIANSVFSFSSLKEHEALLAETIPKAPFDPTANFDSLTNLPNRRLFLDRLEQTLLEAQRKASSFALLFINLDHFKQINDQLGRKAGDRLLLQVAKRLRSDFRAMDTVARLGGDEFALILKETGSSCAKEAAKALLISLEQAFHVDSHRVNLSGSIGLTVFPEGGTNIDQLMCNANLAVFAVKERGGHQVQVYES
ncbi:GGDEF domain-containing protein [Marinobacter vulgaris]|nr:GGDEF domain-containing protein [Marinobacter vulgaris]